jgi:cell division protein FtsX
MDNKCVISLKLAERLGIVYATKNANNEIEYHLVPNVVMTFTPISGNIEKMAGFFQKLESELQTQNEAFLAILKGLFYTGQASDKPVLVAQPQYYQALVALLPYTDILSDEEREKFPYPTILCTESEQVEKLRRAEIDICNELLLILMNGLQFTPEQQNAWYEQIAALEALEADKVNADELKELKSFVVPTDIEIVGAYQTPENMPGPDIYLPLNVAQEALSYSERDAIMGICVRLHDAHDPGDLEKVFYETLKKHECTEATLPPEQEFEDMPPVVDVDYSNMEEETLTPETEETTLTTTTEEQQKPEATADGSDMTGMQWQVSSWKNDLEALYTLIAQERVMMSFVLSIINLIACFCIMAVMFTMSMQRKREIAVLQALGATPRKIVGIFAWQGVIIGFIGAILGMLLALLVLYFRLEIQDFMKQYLMDPFPMEAHGITLPAVYRLELFIKHASIAFVMVIVASIIPAFFVSRQDPAKALRSN